MAIALPQMQDKLGFPVLQTMEKKDLKGRQNLYLHCIFHSVWHPKLFVHKVPFWSAVVVVIWESGVQLAQHVSLKNSAMTLREVFCAMAEGKYLPGQLPSSFIK